MANSIRVHFGSLPDPRRAQGRRHGLADMIVIAVTAVICAADSWSDVRDFGRAKLKWFKTFLDLPHGIPSQDTFERVFARLDPSAFERCFIDWTKALSAGSGGQLVAIDGKRLRRSFAHAWEQSTATHLVSAFVTANATVFAQLAVDSKENEIVAIPKLLQLLDLHGATVTIDAIGCQTAIAREIVAQGGDYILCAKDNQPALARALQADLDDLVREKFKGVPHDSCETVDGDHGRIETRRVWTTAQIDWLGPERDRWAGLRSVAVVESRRKAAPQGETCERRYYISTLDGTDAPRMAAAIRGHWSIENQLHYVLDVSFGEDQSRVRNGHAAENFSRLRRIALNLLRRETTRKRGIKGKRLNAAWDHDYLLKLLTG
jgi:predicted transposase YbfD/YdcC